MIVKNVLDGTYKTFAMLSAEKMFKFLEKIIPDLILLDIDMPEMDGFEAIQILKSDKRLKSIPVIFLSASNDPEMEIHGFEMGALDFIIKPFSPPVLIRKVETHIDTEKLIKRGQQVARSIHYATIGVIADLVENRDEVTDRHVERTQKYLELLMKELVRMGVYYDEISNWDMDLLLPSAQLHDVGKIKAKDIVLNKQGKLTIEEFEMIKQHCVEGERIIDRIISKTKDDGFLLHAKRFAGYHHEKWDGTGYPRGLSGADIPLEGRILAIVDVYDALISKRSYKEAFSHEKAVRIIEEGAGTHFDPVIVQVFLSVADFFAQIAQKHKD